MHPPQSPETEAVHGSSTPPLPTLDLVPPIHMTSTFRFRDVDHGAGLFDGSAEGYIYSRMGNPTVDLLQEKVARLEGAEDAVATASGMAAIAAVVMSLLAPGENLVAAATLYGGSFALFNSRLKRWGVTARFLPAARFEDPAAIAAAIDSQTRLLFIETPANPTLDIVDISLWAGIARRHGIPLIVDNTFASPLLQRPLALGAEAVVHSATKYLGGHGDIIGGVVAGSRTLTARIREDYTHLFGPCLSPFNAWLVLRGIKTLALRMHRHSESALTIARWLAGHPKVARVFYPGLASHPGHTIAKRQMRAFGGMVAFEITGGLAAGKRVMDRLRLCTLAVSLGDCETLIQHPASMTHATYSPAERQAAGISDGLIRLSVGLEAPQDIIADLEQAMRDGPKRA
ncbi:MAG: trans-sulfuration enzyme family protein [Anaerolineae bacterium]